MIKNEEMKANRFYNWYIARKKLNFIVSNLESNKIVTLTTYLKSWEYNKKHVNMFKATKNGLYVQQGKKWVNVDGCKITVWR